MARPSAEEEKTDLALLQAATNPPDLGSSGAAAPQGTAPFPEFRSSVPTVQTCIIPHLTTGHHVLAGPRGLGGRSLGCTRLSADAHPWEGCAEPSDVPLVGAVAVKSRSKAILRAPELMQLLVCLRFVFLPALRTRSSCCSIPRAAISSHHPSWCHPTRPQGVSMQERAFPGHKECH